MFYRELEDTSEFDPSTNLQWLIDTHQKLLQYQQLAHDLKTRLCMGSCIACIVNCMTRSVLLNGQDSLLLS